MSDYIRRSDVIKIIEKAIENSSDFLQHNTQIDIMFEVQELPTLDEKEIIRKAFERIVERLEDKKWGTSEWRDKWRDEIIGECIDVVKEVGGIE